MHDVGEHFGEGGIATCYRMPSAPEDSPGRGENCGQGRVLVAVAARETAEGASIRPGMIVNLRRRTWRVESVAGGVLTATPIDDFGSKPQQFLLELERPEPGALAEPSLESLGDPTLQRLLLQAVRLDALHGTAPFMCIQRAAVIPVEYQLVPLVMALRQQPVRLLLADTTGLGKTIEAGLIVSELLARGRARSVLVVTPASLREQWREQMRELFYLEFEIMSAETRRRLERAIPPGADPWLYYDRLIVSMDYAKELRVRPEILKRTWDIVLVDEAHNTAILQSGRRARMERWELVDQIAARASTHLLLLTATPHNGYTDSYCSLLKMLSADLVGGDGPEMRPRRETAVRHVCQRTRRDVQEWMAEAGEDFPFPAREPAEKTEVPVELHRDYFRILERLDKILDFISLHARGTGREQPAEWLRLHLHRRALSSPEALRRSLENRVQKLMAPEPLEPEVENEESLIGSLGDQGASDAQPEEALDRQADSAVFAVEKALQLRYFVELARDLQAIRPNKDRKLAALRDRVLPELMGLAGEDALPRVILFTRYRDTLAYLERELRPRGEYEVFTLHGELSEAERDRRFAAFAASAKAVLIATDVISEGLNLQTAASMVVHYDIPWNPNRIEQRNGRVDRFGQRARVVRVRTVFCRDTADEDVMHHLVRKLERMRHDLGFCPPFFATEETVLRVLARRRARRPQEPAAQPGLFDREEALFDEEAVERIRSEGFYGQAEVRVRDVAERLREVHARFGSPDEVQSFITTGLGHYGCAVRERADGTLSVGVSNPRLHVAGLPERIEKAVLDPALRAIHADAAVLDVGHPLVRRLNAIIREDGLRDSDHGARTAAWRVPGQRGTLLIGRGVLRAAAATEPPTLLEEVVTFGVRAGLGGIAALSTGEAAAAAGQAGSPASGVGREEGLAQIARLRAHPAWEEARKGAVEECLAGLRSHREGMARELGDAGDLRWLRGFAEIELVGFDLHCLTLLAPEL